jgi:NADH-quinone oxidoreductase subunit J
MPLALLMGVIILMQLALAFGVWDYSEKAEGLRAAVTPDITETHNTAALGLLIYDKYILMFQLAGLILLVAMIGAIVLTLRQREGVRRQSIARQTARTRAESVEVKQVPSRSGV